MHRSRPLLGWSGRPLLWQAAAVLGVWSYGVWLHWNNDGFWFQGDSSRHALNGIFWWDFLTSLPTNPLAFAVRYYSHYPAINPTAYPPFFYLLEGLAYKVFGTSPLVAKALVQVFMLGATFYLMAWLRRWISEPAGWAAALFPLQPAILTWSNAIMLNLPSMALAVAALYHWRRWLEEPESKHCYASGVLTVAAVLTYLPVSIIGVVMLSWVLAEKQVRLLLRPRLLLAVVLAAIPLGVWAVVVINGASSYASLALAQGDYPAWHIKSWGFYLVRLPQMATVPLLVAAGIGAAAAFRFVEARRELRFAGLWLAICYVWWSSLSVKDTRYVLLLLPPLVSLAALGATTLLTRLAENLSHRPASLLVSFSLIILIGIGIPAAGAVAVPQVTGIASVSSFVASLPESERVFYDGGYSGVFTFFTRRSDAHFRRSVVVGHKLLYLTKIEPQFGFIDLAPSVDDVIQALRTKCGCRIVIVERQTGKPAAPIKAVRALREAVQRSDYFHLLRSFHIDSRDPVDIDVYEQIGTIVMPSSFELRFLILGHDVKFDVWP